MGSRCACEPATTRDSCNPLCIPAACIGRCRYDRLMRVTQGHGDRVRAGTRMAVMRAAPHDVQRLSRRSRSRSRSRAAAPAPRRARAPTLRESCPPRRRCMSVRSSGPAAPSRPKRSPPGTRSPTRPTRTPICSASCRRPGSPTLDYSSDVAPWLGPNAGLFLTSLGSSEALDDPAPAGSDLAAALFAPLTEWPFSAGGAQGAIVLDTTDLSAAKTFVANAASHAGAHAPSYRGARLPGEHWRRRIRRRGQARRARHRNRVSMP